MAFYPIGLKILMACKAFPVPCHLSTLTHDPSQSRHKSLSIGLQARSPFGDPARTKVKFVRISLH